MQAYLNLFKKIKIPARVNLIGVIFELAYVIIHVLEILQGCFLLQMALGQMLWPDFNIRIRLVKRSFVSNRLLLSGNVGCMKGLLCNI